MHYSKDSSFRSEISVDFMARLFLVRNQKLMTESVSCIEIFRELKCRICNCKLLHDSVAGPGFAPGSGGYEPPEILLLHPAIGQIITLFWDLSKVFFAAFSSPVIDISVYPHADIDRRKWHKPGQSD